MMVFFEKIAAIKYCTVCCLLSTVATYCIRLQRLRMTYDALPPPAPPEPVLSQVEVRGRVLRTQILRWCYVSLVTPLRMMVVTLLITLLFIFSSPPAQASDQDLQGMPAKQIQSWFATAQSTWQGSGDGETCVGSSVYWRDARSAMADTVSISDTLGDIDLLNNDFNTRCHREDIEFLQAMRQQAWDAAHDDQKIRCDAEATQRVAQDIRQINQLIESLRRFGFFKPGQISNLGDADPIRAFNHKHAQYPITIVRSIADLSAEQYYSQDHCPDPTWQSLKQEWLTFATNIGGLQDIMTRIRETSNNFRNAWNYTKQVGSDVKAVAQKAFHLQQSSGLSDDTGGDSGVGAPSIFNLAAQERGVIVGTSSEGVDRHLPDPITTAELVAQGCVTVACQRTALHNDGEMLQAARLRVEQADTHTADLRTDEADETGRLIDGAVIDVADSIQKTTEYLEEISQALENLTG